MALVLKDRVKQTASNPGTGTITLLTTPTGFQAFSAIGDANITYFAIVDSASGAWEVNYGTYTSSGTTLSRNATPLSSSAGGALVNFTGSVDVFCTYPSSRSAYQNEAGTQVVQTAFGAITATSAALTTGTISTLPTTNTDIVNKQYADAIASGIHFHEAVAYATTAALPAATYNNGAAGVGATLTGNVNGALTVDGYTFTSPADNGTRILVKNQASSADNGVYTLSQAGNSSPGAPFILTRATDFDTVGTGVNQIDEGDFFLVTSGTANANTAWVQQTPPPIIIGTTAIIFQQFAAPITYTAGTGLNESPTYTFNIANTTVSANTYGSASAVPVFAVNAQGQLTSVTNTNIAINGSAVTGAISGQAGSVANALTLGTYLTGTSYNGSAAVTATVDATSANTASKVVARDSSGDFSAGTITATLSGNATNVSGTVAFANGGTGETTRQAAMDALAGGTTSGQYLRGNGSDVVMSTIQAADVPTLNQNTSGNAATATTATNVSGGTASVTTLDASGAVTLSGGTANGVTYLNGSKVLTSGSALTFDGSTLALTGTQTITNSSGSTLTLDRTSNPGSLQLNFGGTQTGQIQAASGGGLIFYQGSSPTEGMRLTSTGLGIGTTTATAKLTVINTADANKQIVFGDSAIYYGSVGHNSGTGLNEYRTEPSGGHGFFIGTSGTANMTLNSSGNLGIGTTSPSNFSGVTFGDSILDVNGVIQVRGDATNGAALMQFGGDTYRKAVIFTPVGTDTPYLAFSLATSGTTSSGSERMRIDSSGNLGIGTSSPTDTFGFTKALDVNGSSGAFVYVRNNGSSTNVGGIGYSGTDLYISNKAAGNIRFFCNTDATERARISAAGGFSVGTTADPGAGAIYATGAITAFYSDARLKTVSGKIKNALDKVGKLSGVYYTNNSVAKSFGYASDEVQVGVLAQEVEAVLPQIVKAAPFDLDQDGNSKSGENYKTVQYEKLVPLLIEAINELQAKVAALEAKG